MAGMHDIGIAPAQLGVTGHDVAANLANELAVCRKAASRGTEIVLFPEMWSISFTASPLDAGGSRQRSDLPASA